MRLLWYIGRELNRGYVLMLVVLLALVSLLGLLDQLEDVGDGRFGVREAWLTVLGMAPARAVSLLPFIALLGSLYALADLARRSELTILEAAGLSRLWLAGVVLLPALVWSGLALPLDEFVAAPMERAVLQARLLAKADGASVLPATGIWSRQQAAEGERLVNVGQLVDGAPQRVRIYRFDGAGDLRSWVRADSARIGADGWRLDDVRRTDLGAARVQTAQQPELQVGQLWGRSVPLAPLPLSSLSPSELSGYVAALDASGQASARVRAVFWQRLVLPASVLAMALLAVPFAIAHVRGGGMALRLAAGAAAGIAFFVAERVFASSAVLAGLPPVLAAVTPALLVSALALLLLRRR